MDINNIIKASIKEVYVYYSESNVVNDMLGCNEHFNINRAVTLKEFDEVIKAAAQAVESGYDKTRIDVVFHTGEKVALRLDIAKNNNCLIEKIKRHI